MRKNQLSFVFSAHLASYGICMCATCWLGPINFVCHLFCRRARHFVWWMDKKWTTAQTGENSRRPKCSGHWPMARSLIFTSQKYVGIFEAEWRKCGETLEGNFCCMFTFAIIFGFFTIFEYIDFFKIFFDFFFQNFWYYLFKGFIRALKLKKIKIGFFFFLNC